MQAEALGIDAAAFKRMMPPEAGAPDGAPDGTPPDVLEVLPANTNAAWLFLTCSSQWRVAGMSGQPMGLDMGAVATIARARDIPLDADTLDRLLVIEREALRLMQKAVA
ncbi:MAG: DUF1799 domain-containing protein [Alphaproteobacteria bacterium]|nr:DUF1799 domain-containing protein [Alphaproteobacteria bacterium]